MWAKKLARVTSPLHGNLWHQTGTESPFFLDKQENVSVTLWPRKRRNMSLLLLHNFISIALSLWKLFLHTLYTFGHLCNQCSSVLKCLHRRHMGFLSKSYLKRSILVFRSSALYTSTSVWVYAFVLKALVWSLGSFVRHRAILGLWAHIFGARQVPVYSIRACGYWKMCYEYRTTRRHGSLIFPDTYRFNFACIHNFYCQRTSWCLLLSIQSPWNYSSFFLNATGVTR